MSTLSATDRGPHEDRIRDLDAQRRAFRLAHPATHTRVFSDEDVAFLLGLVTTLRAERDRLRDMVAEAEAWHRDSKGEDGTDKLCRAVYGREATPRDYLGGSEARMLHDAAALIMELKARALP